MASSSSPSAGSLPPEVVLAIQRVLEVNAEDPLETLSEFSPVDTLNTLFPDEKSLLEVKRIQDRLKEDQHALQTEINNLQLELRRNQDPHRMQIIQELIAELFSQMNRIREKATESEAIVRDITKDIQVLDLAKQNLILSITALKRFQMLVNALGQLDTLIKSRNYTEISQTLAAVKEFAAVFKTYMAVDKIAAVWKRMQELQGTIRAILDEDFDAFFIQDPARAVKPSLITEGCAVVDVIGLDYRYHLIERYCSIELKVYRRIFRASDEAGQLDNISRRFAWFRRMLAVHEEDHARVFPADWKVGYQLCVKFAEITRDDIAAALNKAAPTLTVTLLLESLQQTLDFEAGLGRKYGIPFTDLAKTPISPQAMKTISSVFEPHMGVFVDAQDKAISDMLSAYRGAKSRPSLESSSEDDTTSLVLPSSTEIFYFYRQTLDQCAKYSSGSTLFDLCSLQKKWLRIYAEDVLIASMKRPAERKSSEGRLNLAELRNTCILLNTADYCQATSLELEDKVKEKIDEEYRSRVTLQPERDQFFSIVSTAIALQLRELEVACDTPLTTMMRTSWANLEHVSGPSAYIPDLIKGIESVVEVVREQIQQKKYLRNFYDKAVSLIITRFTNALVKSRPLKETGAEQVLIDLQELRNCLIKLPGSAEGSASTSLRLGATRYSRNVAKGTSHLETLLKVIVTPADPAEGFVLNYTLQIGDSSFSNFQKILDLKGTPRAEQNALLDTFLTVTSKKDDLQATSFLSALDMDPSTSSQIATTLGSPSGRPTLPNLLSDTSLFGSPPLSGADSPRPGESKREVFSDLRRLMSFAVRRERDGGT
ncbi:hypothetical protein BOTBODRAFT_99351 [Botryobasidium botryosum FD-172 SS1]|uniref:Uncharacterized protein n=1 Tax=Botryobasidium botryosum (strain FD-172 SS1) TaxID=930990 RepID=A0A067NC57_BOTB1|nr:hypothetical protein BOTBODRAFT_99351 [Botryobasidium botryosum FD-172 SS1]